MKNEQIDVSVAIITWNAVGYLRRCFESLYAHTRKVSLEVVVVDNASRDGSTEFLARHHPEAQVIVNPRNRGVAPARNQALQACSGRYLLILDVDTEVAEGAIDRIVAFMDAHPEVGLLGPRLIDSNGNLQYTCRRFHTLLTPVFRRLSFLPLVRRSRTLREFQMEEWDHRTPRAVDHVIGACQLIRREAFQQVGLLDGRMFYGWEDTDYCIRMQRAGYQVCYYPDATIIHHEQRATKKRMLNRLTLEHLKAMVLFFAKYPSGMWGRYL